MSENFLLYPAIFIFTLLVIGLVYTVQEFTKMGQKSDDDAKKKQETESERE